MDIVMVPEGHYLSGYLLLITISSLILPIAKKKKTRNISFRQYCVILGELSLPQSVMLPQERLAGGLSAV